MFKISPGESFKFGYNSITAMDEKEDNTMMDFGILKMAKEQKEVLFEADKEISLLLIYGEVLLEYGDGEKAIKRASYVKENPWVLHVPKSTEIKIAGIENDSELVVTRTSNDRAFEIKLYSPEECKVEVRSNGIPEECTPRVVRTMINYSNAPWSNLVIGEAVDLPGKRFNYPPHHHPHPEIYFYKFCPEDGYGFTQIGDIVEMLRNNDTTKLLYDLNHPHIAVSECSMYYAWMMRHLESNPFVKPILDSENIWSEEVKKAIWK